MGRAGLWSGLGLVVNQLFPRVTVLKLVTSPHRKLPLLTTNQGQPPDTEPEMRICIIKEALPGEAGN